MHYRIPKKQFAMAAKCLALAGVFAGIAGTEEAEAAGPPPGLTTLYELTGGADGAILYKGPAVDPVREFVWHHILRRQCMP
jgi:hypothetical protein